VDWFEQQFAGTQVMVILRGRGVEQSLRLAEQAWDAGVRMVEIPIQSAADVAALNVTARAATERGLRVGAGTVLSPEQVVLAKQAGAGYTVSPGTDEDVIRASLDAGLPTMPGVATATDVQRCLRLGQHWLKAFPAVQLGPQWIHAMLAPFPQARFVATGGVEVASAPAFISAGARAVAIGSALDDPRELAAIVPYRSQPPARSGRTLGLARSVKPW
jgi:2-dehydro-3-deoxyphosphogluconate aldolase/(4S)-4-hydroxy-2-oxoglutarate aldolase